MLVVLRIPPCYIPPGGQRFTPTIDSVIVRNAAEAASVTKTDWPSRSAILSFFTPAFRSLCLISVSMTVSSAQIYRHFREGVTVKSAIYRNRFSLNTSKIPSEKWRFLLWRGERWSEGETGAAIRASYGFSNGCLMLARDQYALVLHNIHRMRIRHVFRIGDRVSFHPRLD